MRIGIVTTWFERGAAIVSRAYMDTLSQQHDVFVYARGGKQYAIGDPKWDQENVTWGKRVSAPPLTNMDWADFEHWVRDYQLQVLIFNEQHYWDVILQCLKLDIVTGAYVDYYTAATVPFFGLYDFLLCNTRRHYSVFRAHPQAVYIPWGTDCKVFQPQPSSAKNGSVTFFHSAGMGGVGLRKGTDILVRAFQRVSGNCRLVIHSQVGVETYSDVAPLIQNDARIRFIEATVGAPGLYHLGDVYVYPTRLEGIGLTIAEALACGLPVITTDNAPMNEFVQDGVTGKLVAVDRYQVRSDGYYWPESICSESALAAAMQFYVDNPAELEKQKHQARAYAEACLDWDKNSVKLLEAIAGFSRIKKPRWLESAAARYERARRARVHIAEALKNHAAGNSSAVWDHLVRGILSDPRQIRSRAVWGMGVEAFLGQTVANTLRSMERALRPNRVSATSSQDR